MAQLERTPDTIMPNEYDWQTEFAAALDGEPDDGVVEIDADKVRGLAVAYINLQQDAAALSADRTDLLNTVAVLMAKNAEYEREQAARAPRHIQIGDLVKANNDAGFHKGAEGVVQFVEPFADYDKAKVWVLRNGSSGPVFYLPYELDVLRKVEDVEMDKE